MEPEPSKKRPQEEPEKEMDRVSIPHKIYFSLPFMKHKQCESPPVIVITAQVLNRPMIAFPLGFLHGPKERQAQEAIQ